MCEINEKFASVLNAYWRSVVEDIFSGEYEGKLPKPTFDKTLRYVAEDKTSLLIRYCSVYYIKDHDKQDRLLVLSEHNGYFVLFTEGARIEFLQRG